MVRWRRPLGIIIGEAMGGLAPGGLVPVLTTGCMGISALIVGSIVDPVAGLVPFFGVLCIMISLFFANFWRDPDRPIPKDRGVVLSPADGHVMFIKRERAVGRRPSQSELDEDDIIRDSLTGDWYPQPSDNPLRFETEQLFEEVPQGEESELDVWRIAVFMSPLDVHVNRSPIEGELVITEHRKGKGLKRGPFLPAFKKESEFNERVRNVFENGEGERFEVSQISGALARTIVPWVIAPFSLRRGQRIGMIRLGSRVDVRVKADDYLPNVVSAEEKNASHPKGEFVQAGSSILFVPNHVEDDE